MIKHACRPPWRLATLAVLLAGLLGCSNTEVRKLVDDVSQNGSQAPGRLIEIMSAWDQAQGLQSSELCLAARRVYCAAFQYVRDGCNDPVSFCQTVADAFYGGNFPLYGMTTCTSVAGDRRSALRGQERELQQLCLALRARPCQQGVRFGMRFGTSIEPLW